MRERPVHLLHARVDAVPPVTLTRRVLEAVAQDERRVFLSLNLHSLAVYQRDARLRAAHEMADAVRVDGISVVLLGRLLGLPLRREHRLGFVDWVPALFGEAATRGWRVFYLGSTPGVVERGAEALRRQYPGVRLAVHHGHFDASAGAAANRGVVAAINRWRPHLLLVGMGVPRQEHWILDNHGSLDVNVISSCGAALDYFAGVVPTPPRWSGRLGLEWAFRLAAEPRRLAGRYLVEPWPLAVLVAKEWLGGRAGMRRPEGKR